MECQCNNKHNRECKRNFASTVICHGYLIDKAGQEILSMILSIAIKSRSGDLLLRFDCVTVWACTQVCVCVFACMGWRLTLANIPPECLTLGVCLLLSTREYTSLSRAVLYSVH